MVRAASCSQLRDGDGGMRRLAAVASAVEAAARVVGEKGMLVNKVVIAHPRPELLNEMI